MVLQYLWCSQGTKALIDQGGTQGLLFIIVVAVAVAM